MVAEGARRELAELVAVGARRAGPAGAALGELVEQVDLHLQDALEGAAPAVAERRREAQAQGPGSPAADRALALELLLASLAAVGPRAAKARAVAYTFHWICVFVLVLAELVIALVLILERERLLAPRLDIGTLALYALALQFFLIPAFRRWLERKLLWETYSSVCSDLSAALSGLREQVRR